MVAMGVSLGSEPALVRLSEDESEVSWSSTENPTFGNVKVRLVSLASLMFWCLVVMRLVLVLLLLLLVVLVVLVVVLMTVVAVAAVMVLSVVLVLALVLLALLFL